MELIERIMSKVVGKEIRVEEQLEVAGGRQDICTATNGYPTMVDSDPSAAVLCDHG